MDRIEVEDASSESTEVRTTPWRKLCSCEDLYLVIKVIIFTINVCAWVFSVFFICIGIWILQEKAELGIDNLSSDPAILLLVVGSVLFLITFTGCVGALRENLPLLKVYLLLLVILLLLELISAAVAFAFSKETEDKLFDLFQKGILEYHDDPDSQTIVDELQKKFKCCGAYSFNDWELNPYFKCSSSDVLACGVPYSCCRTKEINSQCGFGIRRQYDSDANKVVYIEGCIVILKLWFNDHMYVIGALGFVVAAVQLILILIVNKFILDLKELSLEQ